MAKRVFELARELGVTSKIMLEKCRAEGLEIKNHMSTLSLGLEATVREWFSEPLGSDSGTAVETTAHVDLASARKEARKRKRRKDTEEPEQAEAIEETPDEQAVGQPDQPVAQVEEETVPSVEEPEAPEKAPENVPTSETLEEPPAEETGEPVEEPEAVEAVESDKPIEKPKVVEPEEPPKPVKIKPAGPQVVPKPALLKGPRVIRVEKPDVIQAPRTRRPAPTPSAGPGEAPAAGSRRRFKEARGTSSGEGANGKKPKRRSPRRRGSRTGESGEKLSEWRNQDLVERSQRLAAAGEGLRRRRRGMSRQNSVSMGTVRSGKVEIDEPMTVKSLSAASGVKVSDLIKRLMELDILATANQIIDRDSAETVMAGYNIELVVKAAKSPMDELTEQLETREKGKLSPRPPVVTFLGHVDHGKTSLMDRIRNSGVAKDEAGGITQHIGAYRLKRDGSPDVVFLDTPGHEAFTAMRARGANMTDIVVLVVAADDGVMPQTMEAISHAKAAGVPIVVALNKIDVPNANIQRALGQLAEQGLQSRQWGGEAEIIETSAETGDGIDNLVETLSLEAELLGLEAEDGAPGNGYVIEAEMDPGFGVLTRILVLDGSVKIGDIILAGKGYGHVRSMRDDRGKDLTEASPGTPVEVSGLDEMPEAGDKFYVVGDIERARSIAEQCRQEARARELAVAPKQGLEELLEEMGAGDVHELAVILKADVQGSVEAIKGSLDKLGTDETRIKFLHAAAGGISSGDVTLAEASGAVIIGFNVVADSSARQLAKTAGVEIHLYRVIYDLIEDMRTALEKGLAPEVREETVGRAEVRQVFKVSRVGSVAGCLATDGVVPRNALVRIIRDQVVLEDGRSLDSLKRFKDDAREVRVGLECGVRIAGYDDIKEGDVLEFYRQVETARTL